MFTIIKNTPIIKAILIGPEFICLFKDTDNKNAPQNTNKQLFDLSYINVIQVKDNNN